jgi:REP element-mobilizing transposase RayT
LGEIPQSITFRLADSLPRTVLDQWREELEAMPPGAAQTERRKRIELALDRGHGSLALRNPKIADIVEESLLQFDNVRYRLQAWVIMPNHVHALITPVGQWTLSQITQVWKSYTSRKANVVLGRCGTFWAPEYFDRAIRDEAHYANVVAYFAANPVKAGLCKRPDDWRYSSSWHGRPGTAGGLARS